MQNLSQRDSKWANILLGTSTNTTIGSHGCTITCLAMAAGLTPDEVNRRMINAGAYANTNLVNWQKVQAAIPWLQFEWRNYSYETDADNQRVKDAITKNGFCLVEVDFDGKIDTPNDRHWVLFIGNQQMIDPWTGVTKSTSYYPIKKGFAVINKIGEPEVTVDEYSGLDMTNHDSMLVAAHMWADVVKYNKYVTKEDFNKLYTDFTDKQKEVDEAIRQRDEARLAQTKAEETLAHLRDEDTRFVADLAGVYQCRQEKADIIGEAKQSITFEDLATKLQSTLDQERIDYDKSLKDMAAQISNLQDQLTKAKEQLEKLEAEKPKQIITTEAVTSVIDRIINWLKRGSK